MRVKIYFKNNDIDEYECRGYRLRAKYFDIIISEKISTYDRDEIFEIYVDNELLASI